MKIDERWLRLHYRISIALTVVSFLVEFVMGMFLINSDMLRTTVDRYFMKYLIIPSGLNLLFLIINTFIIRSKGCSQKHKIYLVSFIFVCINFILFTVHSAFVTTYYISAIAMMLTVIYADYYVTGITASLSLISIIISELFIKWDSDKISIFGSTHRLSEFLVTLIILIAFSVACIILIKFERKKNSASIQKEIERQELKKSVNMDELTGIYNRRAFQDQLKDIFQESSETNHILAIVDVDKFKNINDTWGHDVGDQCLIKFAEILNEYNIDNITPFRYGGDEFSLLFQEMNMEEIIIICKEIQYKTSDVVFKDYPELRITVSFGLAEISDGSDSRKFFIHADHALYEAKKSRNSICVFK